MKTEDRLKEKIGTEAGFRVPDGFFEEAYLKISDSLPERKAPRPLQLTRWQRLKPYVYLAAMFAGIWCTLKMVTIIGDRASAPGNVSLDNPPALVAQAIQNDKVVDVAIPASAVTDATLAAAIDDMDIHPEGEQPLAASVEEVSYEATDPYDVDIDQLRAALDKDDFSDEYYF